MVVVGAPVVLLLLVVIGVWVELLNDDASVEPVATVADVLVSGVLVMVIVSADGLAVGRAEGLGLGSRLGPRPGVNDGLGAGAIDELGDEV